MFITTIRWADMPHVDLATEYTGDQTGLFDAIYSQNKAEIDTSFPGLATNAPFQNHVVQNTVSYAIKKTLSSLTTQPADTTSDGVEIMITCIIDANNINGVNMADIKTKIKEIFTPA